MGETIKFRIDIESNGKNFLKRSQMPIYISAPIQKIKKITFLFCQIKKTR